MKMYLQGQWQERGAVTKVIHPYDGTVLDTRSEKSRQAFLNKRQDIVDGVLDLAQRSKEDPDPTSRIRRK